MNSNISDLELEHQRICTLLAGRLQMLLNQEHQRVRYFHQLAQSKSTKCNARIPGLFAKFHLWPCRVKEKCANDMAASVTMALHVMQIELLEELRLGKGLDHPLARVLLDRFEHSHEDIMHAMRSAFYSNETMVQQELLQHEMESHVRMDCRFLERWIETHGQRSSTG